MSNENGSTVRAVDRSLRIVRALQESSGATVTDVAKRVNLPKSTVYNHIQTLDENGYLVKDGDQYLLGLRFLEHGGHTRNRMSVFQVAKPEIEALADTLGERVNLTTEEHGKGVYLYQESGEDAITLDSYVGKRQYLHSTAFGKAMLAHMPEDRVEAILDRHGMPTRTDRTIGDSEALFAELRTIREDGYATDDEESLQGLRCVAAPILTQSDAVLGAVSVSGPVGRLSGDRFTEEIPERIFNTTNVIEINLAYT